MNVENQVRVGIEYRDGEPWDSGSAALRRAHPFDRLRMTLSGVEWLRVPSEVEGESRPPIEPPHFMEEHARGLDRVDKSKKMAINPQ